MSLFHTQLFLRVIFRYREIYMLKIITLGIAFACSSLILAFSINELGFDRFHENYREIFRVLEKNGNETHTGNRLSNQIPLSVFESLTAVPTDSLIVARVKLMTGINILCDGKPI